MGRIQQRVMQRAWRIAKELGIDLQAAMERFPLTVVPADQQQLTSNSKLTPEVAALICALLAEGNYLHVAAQAAGITKYTLFNWKKWREDGKDPAYVEFAQLAERAQAIAEIEDIRKIRETANDPRNWTASAWLLERKYPERWGRRERLDVNRQEETTVILTWAGEEEPEAIAANSYRVLEDGEGEG